MSRQSFTAADIAEFPSAAAGTVANTTTRTNLWTPAVLTPVAAFDPKPGKAYKLMCGGNISTTATPTIIFTPTWGQSVTPGSNISLGASITLTLPTLASASWYAEMTIGFRSIGIASAGATAIGHGFVVIGGPAATASQVLALGSSAAVTTIDHTTAQGVVLDVTWGTAAAGNSIVTSWCLLQSLN